MIRATNQMNNEELSQREERRLVRALKSAVLVDFPNPTRTGCPGSDILRAIAEKTLPMRDPAFAHVVKCSPCFRELHDMRQGIRRQRMLWISGMAALVLAAVGITYFTVVRPETRPAIQGAEYETVSLDLRPYTVTRSAVPSSRSTIPAALQLSRASLSVALYLPIGAEEGPYELEIQKDGAAALPATKADAQMENHIAVLRVNLNTRSLQVGEYQLALRQMRLSWRLYPLKVH